MQQLVKSQRNIVENLRRRFPEETKIFTDHFLISLYHDFTTSEDFGNNDEKFRDWLKEEQ